MIEARAVVLRLGSDVATDVAIVTTDDNPLCAVVRWPGPTATAVQFLDSSSV